MKFEELYGRKIYKSVFKDDELILGIDGIGKVRLFDDGQSCCENRYATCDDDAESLVGGTLISISTENSEVSEDGDHDCHEVSFVTIQTDKGFIKLTSHNVHNGYYGGFSISVEKLDGV